MKTTYLLVLFFVFSSSAFGQDLKQFLKSCGYGTLAGAGLGIASLVFEKKPNESYGNIARGASFGLYGGIGYGIYSMQRPLAAKDDIVFNEPERLYYVLPTIDGRWETLFVYRF